MKRILKRILSVFCVFMMFMTLPVTSFADEENSETPLPSGITAEEFEKELRDYANSGQTSGVLTTEAEFASAAVGVFRGDQVLYTGYFGNTDIENSIAADENSVYEWGSISKTFVWVSVMQLWEQGKIELDRDIRSYLPEGFMKHLKYDEPVTMLNLMNHTGGWEESSGMLFKDSEDKCSLADALQLLEPEQVYRPGEVQAYSNYGSALAGYIVEKVSGMDYCDYVHKNILDVLGMNHTAVSADHSDSSFVYEQMKKTSSYKFLLGKSERIKQKKNHVSIYPAGAVTGTLNDLLIFAEALTDDSAPLFEHPETQQTMLSGTLFYGETDIPVNSHGFFWIDYSVRVFGHTGATSGCLAEMFIDPQSKTGLAVMINQNNDNWFYSNAPELVFGKYIDDKVQSSGEKLNLSRYYIPSRSRGSGMMKFTSILDAANFGSVFEATDNGSGLLLLKSGDEESQIAGKVISEGGSTVIRSVSTDYIPVKWFVPKILLLSAYIFCGVISVILLLTMLKLKKFGKTRYLEGYRLINSGYPAIIISVILFFTVFGVFSENLGLPKTATVTLGILQILCAGVCTAAAIKAVMSLAVRKKEKSKILTAESVISAAANIIAVSAIVYFELYKFM